MCLDMGKTRKAPVLHIIDTQMRFQNAILLKGQSACHVWDAFIEAWSTVYIGYPNTLRVDHRSIFTSQQWNSWSLLAGMDFAISDIDSDNSDVMIERYHDPLRRIFRFMQAEHPHLDPEIAVRCAIKSINDTMVPEGLVPSYLVFGVIPVLSVLRTELPSQNQRMKAIATAREEMTCISEKLRIRQALRSKLPFATDYIVYPENMMYVFREEENNWTEPYQVTKLHGKSVFVTMAGIEKQLNISQILPKIELTMVQSWNC